MCEEICGNCMHHCYSAEWGDWICTNEYSIYDQDVTDYNHGCFDFLERERAEDR